MNSTLSFTLIQSNLHWENIDANLEQFEQKIKSVTSPMEVVVLPEMFSTGFSMNASHLAEEMNGKTVAWMKRISQESKIILTGSAIIQEHSNYYNRLLWVLPNGQIGMYDKRHLFSMADEEKYFTAGNKRLITQVKGWKICTQICYDLRFPVWNRMQTEDEYDVLLYVANWPERRSEAWKTLLKARAIENQCYVVAVNRVGVDENNITYTGDSCVINPLGEVLYTKANEEDIFTITLDKSVLQDVRTKLPFLHDKDDFIIN